MSGLASEGDLPAVLGSEVSGVVRAVGKDVEGFSENDEIFGSVAPGSGGYAEYTLVTASGVGVAAAQRAVADLVAEDVRPLDEAADAIAAVEMGPARGKVVIQVS